MSRLILAAMLVITMAAAAPAPAPTADELLAQVKGWRMGESARPLHALTRLIEQSTGDAPAREAMAKKLAGLLEDAQLSDDARIYVLQKLPLVASDAQLPLLARLLKEEKTAELARAAIAAIPGEASATLLRESLGWLKGPALVGAINSLGDRRDAGAVEAIGRFLGSGDGGVFAVAARALGRIGTPTAAASLASAKKSDVVRDAQIACAEQLALAGNRAGAEVIYRSLVAADQPENVRMAGLSGLARVAPDAAMPMLLEAMAGESAMLAAHAARVAGRVEGEAATKVLAERLANAPPRVQVLIIEALAERGGDAAREAVARQLVASDATVRSAAAKAMGSIGDKAIVGTLFDLAAAGNADAYQSLTQMTAQGVDEAILARMNEGPAEARVMAIRAAADRNTPSLVCAFSNACGDADPRVRLAAGEALVKAGDPAFYPGTISFLVGAKSPEERRVAEAAVVSVGSRLEKSADRVVPVIDAMKEAPAGAVPSLLRVLGVCGGSEALAAVRGKLGDADASVQDAAVRVLASWNEVAAAGDLLNLAKESANPTHRVLALRGYVRLARSAGADGAAMLAEAAKLAKSADDRRQLLAALGDVGGPGALKMAMGMTKDSEVAAEASHAAIRIAGAMMRTDAAAAKEALTALAASSDPTIQRLAKEAMTRARPAGGGSAMPEYGDDVIDARKKEIAGKAPSGFRLVAYLDCGRYQESVTKDAPSLRQVAGQAWMWPGADAVAPPPMATVAFDGGEVSIEATNLKRDRAYVVGFSWWDYDANGRVQSVWASGDGEPKQLLKGEGLPSYTDQQQRPAVKSVVLPQAIHASGKARISFRREGASNAVVSELWLYEGDVGQAAPATPAATVAPKPEPVKLEPIPAGKTPILILTGNEYPGHKWRETAPLVAKILREDPRLHVTIVDRPEFLADPRLHDYAAVVLNYMNWESPDPGEAARANLKKYVESGKGFVLVHFACGAFQDWPEFREIAGRSYDPKLRGHDPHGEFLVEITAPEHPITMGIKDFKTVDELYTCLAGDRKIEVIAKSKSKVDGKDYAMAFTNVYGKGRVFHCVLGHDVKAFEAQGVKDLYRRGTVWAAGMKVDGE